MLRALLLISLITAVTVSTACEFAQAAETAKAAQTKADKPKTASAKTDQTGVVGFIIDRFNALKNAICGNEPQKPVVPAIVPVIIQPQIRKAEAAGSFKTEADLRHYLECYSKSDEAWENTNAKYLPIIESAASVFGLPTQFLACVLFAESKFEPDAKSKKNAFGLGQHIPETAAHLTVLLKPKTPAAVADFTLIAKSTPAENAKRRKTTLRQAIIDTRDAKTKVVDRSFALKWDEYYADLKRRKLHQGATPLTVNNSTLLNPDVAIGASAMYLHMMMTHLKTKVDNDIVVESRRSGDWNLEVLLVAAGSYNMGPYKAAKILRSIEPPDRKAWLEAIRTSNPETCGYLTTIRNCASSSAKDANQLFLPPMLTPQYSCKPGDPPRRPLSKPLILPEECVKGKAKDA